MIFYKNLFIRVVILLVLSCFAKLANATNDTIRINDLKNQTDVGDIRARIFHKQQELDTLLFSRLQKLFIPSFSYNPSAGFEVGLTFAALKFLGRPDSTSLSTGSIELSVATKGLAYINYKHNIYFPKNRWSLQGNWQIGRTQALDYGVGTGQQSEYEGNPAELQDVFKLKYTSFLFREKAYHKIIGNFYGGIGLNVDVYTGIDEDEPDNNQTYHYQYSLRNDLPVRHYLANSISFNLQFDSRDHPNRPYKGIYANLGVKSYKKAIGSSENATQLVTEFRKYWNLSQTNPQYVLAFWHWGSYLLSGKLPYLELPGTSTDNDERSGRAYTVGRFKGLSFFYSETEYRFPITTNKFISGVAFVNVQSGSNPVKNINLFQRWEPGAGCGLRILYNKYSRSNICIDYGIGNYGSRGFFINLNEAF